MTRVHQLPSFRAARAVIGGIVTHPSNDGHRATAIARALRAQMMWRATGRPTIVPFGQRSRIEARLDGGSSARVLYAALPDYREMRAWQRILRPGDSFVDVGANAGLYTILACELGARVTAVEPLDDAVTQLRRNLELNGYEAEIVQSALGQLNGMMRIGGSDSQRAHLGSDGDLVEVTTVDAVVGSRPIVGLKIDVEGAERQVLEGATELLSARRVRVIQLEWNDRSRVNFGEERQLVARLLEDHGYSLNRPDAVGQLVPTSSAEGPDVFALAPDTGT